MNSNSLSNNHTRTAIYARLAAPTIILGITITCFLAAITFVGDAHAYGILEKRSQTIRKSPEQLALQLYAPRAYQTSTSENSFILAHAIVVKTSPPQGGTASGSIGKVDVWYDAGIRDSLAALAVVSAAGERVDKRDAAIDSADPAHVSVGVNQMTPGKYTVRYRALSADGHMVSGAWEFDVQP
jgi:methionine-rich copper-binding protein CopC